MPCYDPRPEDIQNDLRRANDHLSIDKAKLSDKVQELQEEVAKLKKQKHRDEVEVCKIMTAALSFIKHEVCLLDEYNGYEELFNVKKGLLKYHIEHRKADQKYYIKTLKKRLKKEKLSKSDRKAIKAEIKKAKAIVVDADSLALTNRSVFSSEYLKAAE